MDGIRLTFPILESYGPGSYLRVYHDNATGTVDYTKPITDKVPIRPANAKDPEWLVTSWLNHRWLQGVGDAGWLCGSWLQSPWLRYQDIAHIVVGPFYGPTGVRTHKFAAKIFDAQDRVSGSAPPEVTVTINAAPRGVTNLAAASISGGQLTVSFTKSVDL